MKKYNRDLLIKLEKQYGMPMYVFDEQSFVDNYNEFVNSFKSRYSKYMLSYSYKTNYTPYICGIVKKLGGYAEVVSDMEYDVAKRIGYKDSRIIYNGPYKGPASIEMVLNGGLLNVDNMTELEKIIDIANNSSHIIGIGIRVNIDIGQKFVSRFGFDYENGELEKAIRLIKENSNVKIRGLHCHVGQSRSLKAWENRVNKMFQIIDEFFDEPLEYIDLGSGMFAKMSPELAIQFGNDIPSYEEYAEVVCNLFAKYYKEWDEDDKPILFTEPGTTIINKYIDFIGKVTSVKKIKGKCFAVLNCSKHNLGEICTLKQLPFKIINNNKNQEVCSDVDFVGYTCLEHDIMAHGDNVEIAIDDYVVFENVGGYSNVDKPPFILPNCVMISIDGENNTQIIKRREMFEDVFATYIF